MNARVRNSLTWRLYPSTSRKFVFPATSYLMAIQALAWHTSGSLLTWPMDQSLEKRLANRASQDPGIIARDDLGKAVTINGTLGQAGAFTTSQPPSGRARRFRGAGCFHPASCVRLISIALSC